MGTLDKGEAKDYALTYAILFGAVFILLWALNSFVPDFAISISTGLFIIMIAVLIYLVSKIFHLQKTKTLNFESIVLYGAVIAGIILLLYYYPIMPTFSVKAMNIMSMVIP